VDAPPALPIKVARRRPITRLGAAAPRLRVPVPTLEDIYDEHVWRVYAFFHYRLGSREEAEDLTQATFERALKAFGRYDARKASALTWLMAIAKNLLVDHLRRAETTRTRATDPTDLVEMAGGVADELHATGDVQAALQLLSDRDREVVALRYGADLTTQEIAELKELSVANVQQILSRSLRRMRAALEQPAASAG